MRAAIYPGDGRPVTIETLPDPVPEAGEVVVRVDRCGICGTDLAMTRGGAWDYGRGVQFGHEYAGEIVALGAGVDRLKLGQRIAVVPSSACGTCEGCRTHGNNVLCREAPGGAAAGFADYARLPAANATLLPDTLSMADGALIEPLAIALYGVEMAAIARGERVLVLGGGSVGLYATYWARRAGAGRIAAMSRSPRRAALAIEMGADAFVAFGDDEAAAVTEALGGAPQVVLECIGAEGALARAVGHAAPFGRIVSLGFCTAADPIVPAQAAYKCLTMRFAVGYTMAAFTRVADRIDRGHCDPKVTISSEIALASLPEMMARLRGANDETKVQVRPHDPPPAKETAR